MTINNMNDWLMDFWNEVNAGNRNRLESLQIVAELQWHMIPSKETLKRLRDQFIKDHTVRHKYPLADNCWSCGYRKGAGKYFLVRHHVLALSNGGCNRRINIVTVCNSCHAFIHPWLKKKMDVWIDDTV